MEDTQWSRLASKDIVDKTVANLNKRNFETIVVSNGREAKDKVLQLIPKNSEVLAGSSETLRTIGLTAAIDDSGDYKSIRKYTMGLDMKTQMKEMKIARSIQDYIVGSVAAVTEAGELLVASNTGSQLGAYSYGASHAILVVGTQKIVKNIDEGIKRIHEYCLVKETERVKKTYGWPGSAVNKVLVMTGEPVAKRTTVIMVNEILGF